MSKAEIIGISISVYKILLSYCLHLRAWITPIFSNYIVHTSTVVHKILINTQNTHGGHHTLIRLSNYATETFKRWGFAR